MDASSVVSSLSIPRSHHDFAAAIPSPCGGTNDTTMVHKRWADSGSGGGEGGGGGGGGRRMSTDTSTCYQRSELSGTGTDLSAERPSTRDTTNTFLMRDASFLSSQPDKSDFREKMQSWTVYEDTSSPYLAPRPTTSLASQKPSASTMALMSDIEREMSFLLSRPSTSFPSKPKELVEPLEGLMPEERPVSQKKFLVLPGIGHGRHHHHHHGDLFLRRQRSNLETINQLDYSREALENDVQFFSDYYNHHHHSHNNLFHPDLLHNNSSSNKRCSSDSNGYNHGDAGEGEEIARSPPHFRGDPRDSPSKAGKTGTPMPLPPIHKMKWERWRADRGLAGLEEENPYAQYSSRVHSNRDADPNDHEANDDEDDDDDDNDDDDDDDDLDRFRLKTPETFRTESPVGKPFTITPPPGFR